MDYAAVVRETWRHEEFGADGADYRNLVRYATLAASSHNTQPWFFELHLDRVRILPDFSRRCPAVDPDDHHLYASLGCAVENLLIAGRAGGLSGHVTFDAARPAVDVDFEKAPPLRSPLFEAIPRRQCTRTQYDGKPLAPQELRLLEGVANDDGTSLLLLTSERQKAEVAGYVAQGNTSQFADAAWADELKAWIRFNARDAIRTRDGLYGPVMGNPDVPAWLGRLFMRLAFSSKSQSRKDSAHIKNSSALAVIVSATNDAAHWVAAGRCYQRLALQIAALGLRSAFINQPVEVVGLRSQFAGYLGLGEQRPDLVVRIGHGPEMPRSLRRALDDVIVAGGPR